MFSYVFMKILESRPDRYDRGINFLSGGQAEKIKKRIVKDHVKAGTRILDIGCGTGSLIVHAAKAGASAWGVDNSTRMLEAAQKKITKNGLQDKISIHKAGAVEIDTLFPERSFDIIVSTLVFSELYSEERASVLYQAKKLLKPDGKLLIAGEVQPAVLYKRVVHLLLRFPLAVLTYIISQTGTKPLSHISKEVARAGFTLSKEERSFLDSFIVLTADNSVSPGAEAPDLPAVKTPGDDFSIVKSIWDYIGRWFPNPVEPGLRAIGNPGRNSPVLLTSNFHLTVRRVEKALENEDAFLLVAPANGINVWCASTGGELNTHSAISVIKTSRIQERVDHNKIILPQFSAPGIERELLQNTNGRRGIFGPAYARDIPAYLKNTASVFEKNRADFSLPFRLEMLLSMNFIIWLPLAVLTLCIRPDRLLPLSICFWLSGFILYSCYPLIPGKSGWLKAFIFSIAEVAAAALYSVILLKMPAFTLWRLMVGFSLINLMLGFDLKGTAAGYPSEAERLMLKLGMKSFGHLFSAEKENEGLVQQDINRCNNCRTCLMVCPKGVFGIVDEKNIRIINQSECLACGACVKQCGENALKLGMS